MIWPFKKKAPARTPNTILAEIPTYAAEAHVKADAAGVYPGKKSRDAVTRGIAAGLKFEDAGLTGRSDGLLVALVASLQAEGIEITGPPQLTQRVAHAHAAAANYLNERAT